MNIKDISNWIDFNNFPEFRRGFGNMRKKMEEINGKFDIRSENGNGVIIEVTGNLA